MHFLFGCHSQWRLSREKIVTILLVDLGNTALKWSTSEDPGNPHTYVHSGATAVSEELLRTWMDLNPTRVFGCMVSSEALALSLTKFFNRCQINWEWLQSEKTFEGPFFLENAYSNVHQLGSDRWHAAIGAASLFPNEALLVAQLGTATTVDTVIPTEKGMQFLGGRILAGPSLMVSALTSATQCRYEKVGESVAFPLNTVDAISTGIIEAHLGVFELARRAIREKGFEPRIVFAGGAAPLMAPYITKAFPNAVQMHNLVLHGLALRARLS